MNTTIHKPKKIIVTHLVKVFSSITVNPKTTNRVVTKSSMTIVILFDFNNFDSFFI